MKKITVLFPIDKNQGNPYVDELAEIMSKDFKIIMDRNEFWNSNDNTDVNYDIIHLHWPESLFGWNTISNEDLLTLERKLNYWENNSRILYTRHNFNPHMNWVYKNKTGRLLYELISKYANTIVHFGRFSVNDYKQRYKNVSVKNSQRHEVIPHGLYNSYENSINKKEARKILKIPKDNCVILCFGAIRNKLESKLVKNLIQDIPIKNKLILVPRWNFSLRTLLRIGQNLFYKIHPYFMLESKFVPEKEIEVYFNACDIVLIPRLKSLNSGLVSLAFTFKKVVVGLNDGIIGELLLETNNPTFENNNRESVVSAIMKGLKLAETGKGLKNYIYGKKHWSSSVIKKKYKEVYISLLKR